VIFAMAAFIALLNQLNTPSPEIRIGTVGLMLVVCCHTLFVNFVPPRASPVAYPPYYPPDIQKLSTWMRSDELIMSDIPWAVAWYGDRPSIWLTTNARKDFFAISDQIKHVSALYLTLSTMDGRLYSECVQGGANSWNHMVFRMLAANQLPEGFPLQVFPAFSLNSGLFLTDRVRWETE